MTPFFLPLSSHQSHKNRNFPMKLSGVMLWECENMHRNFQRLSQTIATFWYSQRFSRTQCPQKILTLCSPFSHHHSHKNYNKPLKLSWIVVWTLIKRQKNYCRVSGTIVTFQYSQQLGSDSHPQSHLWKTVLFQDRVLPAPSIIEIKMF